MDLSEAMDDFDRSVFVVNNLTEDNLKEFSVARSKTWIKMSNKLIANENLDDFVNIDELVENSFASDEEQEKDTDEENYEVDSIENSVESNDSVLNISVIEENLTASDAKNVLAVIAQNPNTTRIFNGDREFLEKTLPIFETFHREVRQNGLYKLLNTFDERKIEKNIGKILRPRVKTHKLSPYNRSTCFNGSNNYQRRRYPDADNDTDSDSVDEARYVRSTRKNTNCHKRYEMTTTTIKSYCSVKSRRDKLREKYAYDVTDRTMNDFAVKHCHCMTAANVCQSWAGQRSCHHHSIDERRLAHKSQNITNNYNRIYCDSSQDKEKNLPLNRRYGIRDERTAPCQCHHCSYNYYTAKNLSHASQHSYQYDFHVSHSSCCRDMLPLVRESDCNCCGTNKLCNNARHLANSSSDDWFVENNEDTEISDSQSKVNQKAMEKRKQREDKKRPVRPKKRITDDSFDETTSSENEKKTKLIKGNPKENVDKVKKSKQCSAKSQKNNKNMETKKILRSKTLSSKMEPKVEQQKSSDDDSFKRELQLAIEASKELYAAESKKHLKKSAEPTLVQTALRKPAKKNVSFQDEHKTKTLKNPSKDVKNSKQFVPRLSDISSESEYKENESKTDNDKKDCKNKRLHGKAFNNLELEENKKAKSNKKSKNPIKIKNSNKKKVTKTKNKENLKSSQLKDGTENMTYSTSKLNKLQICEDSSSDSTDVDNTVKMKAISSSISTSANLTENTTFFTNPGKICNSTALPSQIDKSCQLPTALKYTKASNSSAIKSNHHELPSTSKGTRIEFVKLQTNKEDLSSPTDSSDCKRVSSTTQANLKSIQETPNIILYTPDDTKLVPESSFVNGKYRLTLEHLGSVIGEKYAKVFFRYYRGKIEFNLTSTVNYIPPKRGYYSGNDTSEDDIDLCDVPDIGKIIEKRN